MLLNFAKKSSTINSQPATSSSSSASSSTTSSNDLNRMSVLNELISTFNLNNTYNTNNNESSNLYKASSNSSSGIDLQSNRIDDEAIMTNGTASRGELRKLSNHEELVGEEEHDDCVYIIKFKKIFNNNNNNNNNSNNNEYLNEPLSNSRSSKSTQQANPNGTYRPLPNEFRSYINDTSLSMNSDGRKSVGLVYTKKKIKELKYASLAKIVEHLTSTETGQLDTALALTLMATYRTFTETSTLIGTIQRRYGQIVPASLEMTEDVRIEHLNSLNAVVHFWLENYSEDFDDTMNLHRLNEFCTKHMQPNQNDSVGCAEILALIKAKYEQLENRSIQINVYSSSSANSLKLSEPSLTPNNTSSHRRTNSSCLDQSSSSNKSKAAGDANTFMKISASASACAYDSENVSSNYTSNINKAKSLLLALSPLYPCNDDNNNINYKNFNSQATINGSSGALASPSQQAVPSLFELGFMKIDSKYFAEQLTYLDKELFRQAYAYLCIASVWATRHKTNTSRVVSCATSSSSSTSSESALHLNEAAIPSALPNSATVQPMTSNADKFVSTKSCTDQFNLISFMVQSTILENLRLKPSNRAKIIEKWIEIGSMCKKYKNYSSLNAIVQGLNIQCISCLEKTWSEVSSDSKKELFHLTELFSEDHNQKQLRDLLMKDLARYRMMFGDDFKSRNKKTFGNNRLLNSLSNSIYEPKTLHGRKNSDGGPRYLSIKNDSNSVNATLSRKMKDLMIKNKNEFMESCGTVPFLGTFLKDLEYISAAYGPIRNEKGLINLPLKHKEYEIIAQMQLFQKATQLYDIVPDDQFKIWLHQQPIYSETQNYELSQQIEPKNERENRANSKSRQNHTLNPMGSIESLNSFKEMIPANKTPSSTHSSKEVNRASHSRASSYGSSDIFYMAPPTATNGTNNMLASFNSNLSSNGDGSISSSLKLNDMAASNSIGKSSPLSSSSTSTTSSQRVVIKVNIEYDSHPSISNNNHHLNLNGSLQAKKSPHHQSLIANHISGKHGHKNWNNESLIAETTMYKLIYLKDSDRTKDVKRNILEKFHMNADTSENYVLYQLLSNGPLASDQSYLTTSMSSTSNQNKSELLIKDNCNVYYASKHMPEMEFVLRRRNIVSNGNGNLPRSMSATYNNRMNMSSALPPQSPNHQPNKPRRKNSITNIASFSPSTSSHTSSGSGSSWLKKMLS